MPANPQEQSKHRLVFIFRESNVSCQLIPQEQSKHRLVFNIGYFVALIEPMTLEVKMYVS